MKNDEKTENGNVRIHTNRRHYRGTDEWTEHFTKLYVDSEGRPDIKGITNNLDLMKNTTNK